MLCLECNAQGFGAADVMRGFSCESCGQLTQGIRPEIQRYTKCGYQFLNNKDPTICTHKQYGIMYVIRDD